jgi:4,5-dihydroxyphthalate decarboxylase
MKLTPTRLALSLAMARNPRTRPIFDSRVTAEGIDLVCSAIHPSELFWRQLRFADFDVSEMSFSSLLMTHCRGDTRWAGLPVFTTREFFHTRILVRRDAGIAVPADLKGKRVGVPEYQMTAALWTRGILEHEFGVKPADMEFWMERGAGHSHGGATGFVPPPGVTVHTIPPDKDIGAMLLSGELDATLRYMRGRDGDLVDRATADLTGHPAVRPLFDPLAEGARYYTKTGIFPINHGMVIKRAIAEAHPWVALNLYKAFVRANEIAETERAEHVAYHVAAGLAPQEALRTPLVRHGLKANRTVLETAARYSHEQGLTPRVVRLDEVFAPSTLEQ